MTTSTDQDPALLGALRGLTDRAEIGELLDRYLLDFDILLDQPRDDDRYRRIFTEDLRLTFPVGGHRGVAGLAAFQRTAKSQWARTQHLSTNHVIDLDPDHDPDRARLRARLLVAHVHPDGGPPEPFTAGSHIDAQAVRTEQGWRLRELTIHLIWTTGRRPA